MSRRVITLGLVLGAGLLVTGTARAQKLFANPACGPTCARTHVGTWIQQHRDKNATICAPQICPHGCYGYFRTQWTPWMCPDGTGCTTPIVTHPALPVGPMAVPMVTHPAPAPMVTHPAPPARLPVAPMPSTPSTSPPKSEPKAPQSSARPAPPPANPLPIPTVPVVSVSPKPAKEAAPTRTGLVPPARFEDLGPVVPPVPVVAPAKSAESQK